MLLLLRRASFHTWRQRLDELAFERLVNDGRSTAQGRTTLVSNNWTFTHAFFCRSLINKLKSAEEFKMPVWPMDAWQESIRCARSQVESGGRADSGGATHEWRRRADS
jgi:hypothetical protein